MAVMLIPVTAVDGPNGLRQVSRRLWYRLLGCLAGGALAALVLGLAALLHGPARAALMLLGTALGVAWGGTWKTATMGAAMSARSLPWPCWSCWCPIAGTRRISRPAMTG
ncbi:hypothetical protein ACFS32_03115 [Novosphingobium pokkalii]|uniref:hypothetical protein n=1 Tax=Novosphingobium pokkalii TaxID=1770194 RepID=UPI0036458434